MVMLRRRDLWTFIIAIGCVLLHAPFSYSTALESAQHGGGDAPSPSVPQQVPVQLSPMQRQLIGVTYGAVERRPLTKVSRPVGSLEYHDCKSAAVTLKY